MSMSRIGGQFNHAAKTERDEDYFDDGLLVKLIMGQAELYFNMYINMYMYILLIQHY